MIKDGFETKMQRQKNDKKAQFEHKTLEERAAEFGEKLFLDGEYDWGEPEGREIW